MSSGQDSTDLPKGVHSPIVKRAVKTFMDLRKGAKNSSHQRIVRSSCLPAPVPFDGLELETSQIAVSDDGFDQTSSVNNEYAALNSPGRNMLGTLHHSLMASYCPWSDINRNKAPNFSGQALVHVLMLHVALMVYVCLLACFR